MAGAVARNRIRRRLRSAIDQLAPELVPGDYLISPDPACRGAAFTDLVRCLRTSLASAGALRTEVR
jgi:ribonuclease P protein component